MDRETLQLLQGSLRHVLTAADDRPLAARLDELGWAEVVADDRSAALVSLFEVKGATRSSADALGALLGEALADSVGDGSLRRAQVVLPAALHPDHPSSAAGPAGLAVHGVLTATPGGTTLVVPVGGADGVRLAVVASGADGLTAAPVHGMDPDLGLVRVDGTVDADVVRWLDGQDAAAAWCEMSTAARWALAAELVGVGRHVVASAVGYAGDRRQYGRPIGTFQALQHRLAEAYSGLVGAGHTVDEAAATGSDWVALVAKALAGRACEEACRQAQQTYGAIGFTWEHEFHGYLRRCYVLDALFGDWRTLEVQIGTQLHATRRVPRVGAL